MKTIAISVVTRATSVPVVSFYDYVIAARMTGARFSYTYERLSDDHRFGKAEEIADAMTHLWEAAAKRPADPAEFTALLMSAFVGVNMRDVEVCDVA